MLGLNENEMKQVFLQSSSENFQLTAPSPF